MWCEASLTGFSHMMLYQQAANERKCPGKIQGKCFNYFRTFSKMVDSDFLEFFTFFYSALLIAQTHKKALHTQYVQRL